MLNVREVGEKEYEKRYAEVSDQSAVACSACGRVRARRSMERVDSVLLCRDCAIEQHANQPHVEAESHMEFHEVCLAFPLMDEENFKELCEDIKAHGLRNDIVTYQGKIIDGRNRYHACQKVGVPPRMREWDEKGSLAEYVISMNLKRRHLTASERAELGAKLMPQFKKEAADRKASTQFKRGKPPTVPEKIPGPSDKGDARDNAAKAVGVNPRYIDAATKLREKSPELADKVASGALTIGQAKRVLAGEPLEQVKQRKPRKRRESPPVIVKPEHDGGPELKEESGEELDKLTDQTRPEKPAEDQACTTTWGVIMVELEKLQQRLEAAPKPTREESALVLAAIENFARTVHRLADPAQDAKGPSLTPPEPPTQEESDRPADDRTATSVDDAQDEKTPAENNTVRGANSPQSEPPAVSVEESILCSRNGGDKMNVGYCRDHCRNRKDCKDYNRWATTAKQQEAPNEAQLTLFNILAGDEPSWRR
jgi:hypothetical protein